MPKRPLKRARLLAGAFLLFAAAAAGGDPLQIAAERPDAACPPGGRVLGIVRSGTEQTGIPPTGRCVLLFSVEDLSEAALEDAAGRLARLPTVAGVVLELPAGADPAHFAYAVKKLSSAIRSASPSAAVALDLGGQKLPAAGEDLSPYFDAQVSRPGELAPPALPGGKRWVFLSRGKTLPVSALLETLRDQIASGNAVDLIGLLASPSLPLEEQQWQALERLQAYWTGDVSRDPTPTKATRPDGSSFEVLRFYDAKRFTPLLFLPQDRAGNVDIGLSGGPFAKAAVENLETGARRDFDLRKASALRLDLALGALAVRLVPAARPGGEAKAAVEVGATRGLSAEEIVARERAWDAGQREKAKTFIADMKASLRFRVGRVNETFDLTIQGPFFFRRGAPPDWTWQEFYLNGVRWKGKTLPKLPILQPEKVTTLPLDIRLTEDYAYSLKGETTLAGRRAYEIGFTPKSSVGDRPAYHGTAWIDAQTFALLRRDSVQMNLKGETLSNVQSEVYRPVPGRPDVVLPLQIHGQQVFSTAGRTTAIERVVVMSHVEVNPPDFAARRAAAYSSPSQMVRDTPHGMRYLVPDPENPGGRVVEEKISKKSTFGLVGGFYDNSLDYPLPLLGVQHFNFDLWGRGKQLSVFFGGALLTANYTDPALLGSRLDLGADLFAVAIPFGDVSYRNGKEVRSEKIKHLPALFQVNLGRPLGPYLKASLGLFTKWDDYQRDQDTGANFRTPVDTFTDGAELRLVANFSGYNATVTGGWFRRRRWEPWGDPATSEYSPSQKQYWKYSVSLSKDHYFSGFRKLHVGLAYLGGKDLDRFSKYEFGTFSGNLLHGYKSGSLRTENAWVAKLSYGLNIEDIIRFEAAYDQAIVRDRRSGFRNTYFSGAGLIASFNGPWSNTLVRGEIGVPVVSHGVRGFTAYVLLLKLF